MGLITSGFEKMAAASGKTVAKKTYIHVCALGEAQEEPWDTLRRSAKLVDVRLGDQCNVVRFDQYGPAIAFLNYRDFFDERLDALTRAFSLAERLLVVSVMLANQNAVQGQRFRDGILTWRGTFQKCFTQPEIKAFLEAALEEEPIPVAPGVLYVFRDKDAEQRFLVNRYRSRRNLLRSPSVTVRERSAPRRRERTAEKYETYREPLERLWECWISLGRAPDKTEVGDLLPLTEGFGTLGKALRFIEARKDPEEIDRSRNSRIADLEVDFGRIRLTYGFCSPELAREGDINKRVA